jgi:hypothetical protein
VQTVTEGLVVLRGQGAVWAFDKEAADNKRKRAVTYDSLFESMRRIPEGEFGEH